MTSKLYTQSVEENILLTKQVEELQQVIVALKDRVKWLEYKLREATERPVEYTYEHNTPYLRREQSGAV